MTRPADRNEISSSPAPRGFWKRFPRLAAAFARIGEHLAASVGVAMGGEAPIMGGGAIEFVDVSGEWAAGVVDARTSKTVSPQPAPLVFPRIMRPDGHLHEL